MSSLIQAELSYAVPPADGSKPYAYAYVTDPETKERKRNFTQKSYQLEIENLRGKEDTVSLDAAGFQFARAEAKHKAFVNNEDIAREYYPECEELIKKVTGASRVLVFDHSEFVLMSGLCISSLRMSAIRRHNPGVLYSESTETR